MPVISLHCGVKPTFVRQKISIARTSGRSTLFVRAEGPKIVREYREDDDKIINAASSPSEASKNNPNSAYVDDLPEIPRSEMSAAMKERLRKEYYSLGGAPNQAMGANWFLNISLIVAALAILSGILGYLG